MKESTFFPPGGEILPPTVRNPLEPRSSGEANRRPKQISGGGRTELETGERFELLANHGERARLNRGTVLQRPLDTSSKSRSAFDRRRSIAHYGPFGNHGLPQKVSEESVLSWVEMGDDIGVLPGVEQILEGSADGGLLGSAPLSGDGNIVMANGVHVF